MSRSLGMMKIHPAIGVGAEDMKTMPWPRGRAGDGLKKRLRPQGGGAVGWDQDFFPPEISG
jgi:hypothetical protein